MGDQPAIGKSFGARLWEFFDLVKSASDRGSAWPDVASPPVTTRSLDRGDSDRLRTFGSLFDLELDALIILERTASAPTDLGVVDEHIFSTAVGSDKAKTLIVVEPFDGSLRHIS